MISENVLNHFVVDPTSPSGLRWAVTVGQGHSRRLAGTPAGSLRPSGYYQVTLYRKIYSCHRLVAQICKVEGWEHLDDPNYEVDHIKSVQEGGTNVATNLRVVTCRQNSSNRKVTGKNHLVGAYPRGKRWRAGACINGKMKWFGTYDTEKEAHEVYISVCA